MLEDVREIAEFYFDLDTKQILQLIQFFVHH